MNKENLLIVVLLFSIMLVGCSTEQIEDAIDECKNDPACYQIVDSAISTELESRGIQGGVMTKLELENVFTLFNQIKDTYDLTTLWVWNSNDETIFDELQSNCSSANCTDEQMQYFELINQYVHQENNLSIFAIKELFENEKQYLEIDQAKHILYSVGNNTYKYEIRSAYTVLEYLIDLDFNTITGLDEQYFLYENSLSGVINNGLLDHNNIKYIWYNNYLIELTIQSDLENIDIFVEMRSQDKFIDARFKLDVLQPAFGFSIFSAFESSDSNNYDCWIDYNFGDFGEYTYREMLVDVVNDNYDFYIDVINSGYNNMGEILNIMLVLDDELNIFQNNIDY